MTEKILKKVSDIEKPKVLETLSKNWCQHFILHQYINLMSTNLNRSSRVNQTLYCSGDFKSGVYLIQTEFLISPEKFTLFFVYTTSPDESFLRAALMETSIINWNSKRYMFEVTIDRFTPVVGGVFVSKGFKALAQHYLLFWLPPETLVDYTELPGDVFIRHLGERHAREVSNNWYEFPGCEQFVAEEISVGHGLGLFRKSDGRMLSSILSFHSGGVFMLYSLPEERRNGYGELVLRHVAKELQKQGVTPFCTVFSDNIPSLNLVRKVGFRLFDKASYIFPSHFLQKYE